MLTGGTQPTMACEWPTPRHPDGRTGTDAGYQAHITADEHVCDACRAAHRACHRGRDRERSTAARLSSRWRTLTVWVERGEITAAEQRAVYAAMIAAVTAGQWPLPPTHEVVVDVRELGRLARPVPPDRLALMSTCERRGYTGTYRGARHHYWAGEQACEACADARRAYYRARRIARASAA